MWTIDIEDYPQAVYEGSEEDSLLTIARGANRPLGMSKVRGRAVSSSKGTSFRTFVKNHAQAMRVCGTCLSSPNAPVNDTHLVLTNPRAFGVYPDHSGFVVLDSYSHKKKIQLKMYSGLRSTAYGKFALHFSISVWFIICKKDGRYVSFCPIYFGRQSPTLGVCRYISEGNTGEGEHKNFVLALKN